MERKLVNSPDQVKVLRQQMHARLVEEQGHRPLIQGRAVTAVAIAVWRFAKSREDRDGRVTRLGSEFS